MRILKIVEIKGSKLIVAGYLRDQKGYKPVVQSIIYFEYCSNGLLIEYHSKTKPSLHAMCNYKDSLKYILNK